MNPTALFAAAALALLLAAPARAAEPPQYDRYALQLPGRLINIAAEDLDGDGLRDIVAFCLVAQKRKEPYRCVSVFYQRKGSGFPQQPDQTWEMEHDAAAFEIGDIYGNGRKAVCYLSPSGLFAYAPSGRTYNTRPAQVVKAESVFSQEDPSDLPRWPMLLRGRDGGAAFIFIPTVNRLLVYSGNGGPYRQAGSLPFPARTAYAEPVTSDGGGPITVSHRLPSVSTAGLSGPSSQDLVVAWDDKADIYQKRPGGFGDPPYVRFRPGLLGPAQNGGTDGASVQVVNMKADAGGDIVVTKTTGGLAQTKSLVFVYTRGAGETFLTKPSQTIITEGVIGPRFIDINGDGRTDIVLPSVKMGMTNIINMLTSRQINMTLGIYLQDANGRFPERPDKEKGINFRLDVSNLGKNAKPVMAFGRFTKGPGCGLAVASRDDQVSVYLPDRYSILSDNPGLKLKVDAPSEMDTSDLNGDGISDLLMSYRKIKEKGGQINVFLSK